MLWLIGIASVWLFACAMVVALCVAARRGDEIMLAPRHVPDPIDVDFVMTFAAPEPEPVRAPAPAVRPSAARARA